MGLYLLYSFHSVRKEKNTEGIPKQEVTEKTGLAGPLLMSAAGILLLLSGGEILLRIALHIIKQFNMAKTFIGLSLISFGTALPEFVTSVVAVLKKEYNISVGNIIGTVIFNTFAVIGAAAVLSPVHVPETLLVFELPVLLFFSCLLFLFFWTKSVLSRIEGAVLIFGYVIFLIILGIKNL
jgi:cation:H+ antiporter